MTRYPHTAKFTGGMHQKVASKTAAYTATADDHVILCNATSAAFSVTLPALADAYKDGAGLKLYITKTDASVNAVTVDGSGAETINGAATYALASQYSTCCLVAGPNGWLVLAS